MGFPAEVLFALADDQSIVIFLFHLALKSSTLLLLVLLITMLLSTFSSAKKHFIWAVTFFILLLLPVLSIVYPRWEVPFPVKEFLSVSEVSTSSAGLDNDHTENRTSGKTEDREGDITPVSENIAHSNPPSLRKTSEVESFIYPLYSGTISLGKRFASNNSFLSVLLMIWATGFVILVLKCIIAHLMIYRLYMNSTDLDDHEWKTLFSDLKACYKISRPVRLLKNSKVKSPMTWGVIRPKIVIPSEMESWTEEKKQYVLLHEFAHIKRMDLAIQYMAGIVCMIQWFNPLVWISRKRMSNECEYSCDDFVLEKCTSPSSYASLLLEVARSSLKWNYASSVAISMAGKNHLEKRLLSIFNKKRGRSKVTWLTACTMLFGIHLLAVPLIMFSPFEEGPENPVKMMAFTPFLSDFSIMENQDNSISPAGDPEQGANQDTSTVTTLTDILYDKNRDIRMQAVDALGKIGTTEAVNSVIVFLRRHKWEDLDDVVDIFSSLSNSFPLQSLMDSIKSTNRNIRRVAIFSLNDAPGVSALSPLCDYMEDEDSEIREEAAKGLGRIGVPDVLHCLIPHLKDEERDVRVEVIEAIGNIQNREAVPALSEALTDESSDVREEAAEALGAIRDPAAVKPLSLALNDENSEVREEAAEALGKIGDQSAVEPLTNALKQESENEVRREIMNAIGNIFSARSSQIE